jgi:phage-related protein
MKALSIYFAAAFTAFVTGFISSFFGEMTKTVKLLTNSKFISSVIKPVEEFTSTSISIVGKIIESLKVKVFNPLISFFESIRPTVGKIVKSITNIFNKILDIKNIRTYYSSY